MESIEAFNKYAKEYDEWFDLNENIYKSEINALKMFIPESGEGLEVGVGTGRFASVLGIKIGVEPAKSMAEIARKRGIKVYEKEAQNLPFSDSTFDFILFVTTICFLKEPILAIKEAKRVLKPGGSIIIGIIDKNSFLGKLYEKKKESSKFYKYAKFYSTDDVINWLKKLNFREIKTVQTLFKNPKEIREVEPVKEGYGEGGFVVLSAIKTI